MWLSSKNERAVVPNEAKRRIIFIVRADSLKLLVDISNMRGLSICASVVVAHRTCRVASRRGCVRLVRRGRQCQEQQGRRS